jgi:N6-adenosine-specific RNA methylase IME4
MSWPFDNLLMFKYEVVVADPPWEFELRSEKGNEKAASAHYDTMPIAEIKALPVANLVRHDSLLLLWTTGWAIATGQAQDVARAWGAEPVTELVWIKRTINGKNRVGTGYRARSMHEPILLAKWGNPKHSAFPSAFDGLARRHSEKPDEFYDSSCKEDARHAYRCDLFSAGIERPGFEGWGEDHRSGEPVERPKSEDQDSGRAAHPKLL